ncbi:hypothetical protein DFH07DRAFT_441573 [Mycena maculata]|uniref:Uncharacterized protein n=1 Tax=Mycena maculata TaxID=230809 RepID=A0AAD7NGL0_9AGAR|nr:hypothetical protein DFH07DRAFT_441573 [Mycena maculata]
MTSPSLCPATLAARGTGPPRDGLWVFDQRCRPFQRYEQDLWALADGFGTKFVPYGKAVFEGYRVERETGGIPLFVVNYPVSRVLLMSFFQGAECCRGCRRRAATSIRRRRRALRDRRWQLTTCIRSDPLGSYWFVSLRPWSGPSFCAVSTACGVRVVAGAGLRLLGSENPMVVGGEGNHASPVAYSGRGGLAALPPPGDGGSKRSRGLSAEIILIIRTPALCFLPFTPKTKDFLESDYGNHIHIHPSGREGLIKS